MGQGRKIAVAEIVADSPPKDQRYRVTLCSRRIPGKRIPKQIAGDYSGVTCAAAKLAFRR
jgi:hypothetical protein